MTVVALRDVAKESPSFRFDSEYFKKEFLQNRVVIKKYPAGYIQLQNIFTEMTGGATPLGADYLEEGVRFLRVQNIMQNYIDDSDLVYISAEDDEILKRSRLKPYFCANRRQVY